MSVLSLLLLLLAAAVLHGGLRARMYAAQDLALANFSLFGPLWPAGSPLATRLELVFRPSYLAQPRA